MKKEIKEDWEKEFDKEFIRLRMAQCFDEKTYFQDIKSFIRQLLIKQKKKLKQKHEKVSDNLC